MSCVPSFAPDCTSSSRSPTELLDSMAFILQELRHRFGAVDPIARRARFDIFLGDGPASPGCSDHGHELVACTPASALRTRQTTPFPRYLPSIYDDDSDVDDVSARDPELGQVLRSPSPALATCGSPIDNATGFDTDVRDDANALAAQANSLAVNSWLQSGAAQRAVFSPGRSAPLPPSATFQDLPFPCFYCSDLGHSLRRCPRILAMADTEQGEPEAVDGDGPGSDLESDGDSFSDLCPEDFGDLGDTWDNPIVLPLRRA